VITIVLFTCGIRSRKLEGTTFSSQFRKLGDGKLGLKPFDDLASPGFVLLSILPNNYEKSHAQFLIQPALHLAEMPHVDGAHIANFFGL
jgi:hypothetical protein